MKKKIFLAAAMAAMLASCSELSEQQAAVQPSTSAPAVAGVTPVGFSAYSDRGVSRGGVTGELTIEDMKDVNGTNGFNAAGFGVFAYYTNAQDYAANTKPDFMYNQQVKYDDTQGWNYTPVKYWPNEYGADAQSVDQDKVSFFAYAPYLATTDASQGTVSGNTWGITGFSRNNANGDPIVKYQTTFNLSRQVDLCWGVAKTNQTWKTLSGADQTISGGLPWLDVEHPATIDQKMTFNFRHALAQLNVQIDVDADLQSHEDGNGALKTGTKVYVRSITFGGFAQKGALNLNNSETGANTPNWLNYSGQGELSMPKDGFTLNDGRKNGKEGVTSATENNSGMLNPAIIQDAAATTGVTENLQNLFNTSSISGWTATQQLEAPVYVIPAGNEPLTVTIVYDVETEDANLSGKLSDGQTNGSSIENKITKEITFGSAANGIQAGSKYTVKLHLGLNSVKFEADVATWTDTNASADSWLPSNTGEGVYNANNPITINNLVGASTTAVGKSGADATKYTIAGLELNNDAQFLTMSTSGNTTWTVKDPSVALIAAAGTAAGTRGFAGARGMTRAFTEENWKSSVTSQYIAIKPLKKGQTVIQTEDGEGNISTCVLVVDGPTVELTTVKVVNTLDYTVDASSVTLYKFSSDSPKKTITCKITSANYQTQAGTNETLATTDGSKVTAVKDATGTEVDEANFGNYVTLAAGSEANTFDITPVDVCTAEITVKTNTGATAICNVTVAEPKITLSNTSLFMKSGGQSKLTWTSAPSSDELAITGALGTGAAGFTFTQSTSGKNEGVVEATGNGTGTIEFKFAGHDEVVATCEVTVQNIDPGILLSEEGGKAVKRILVSDVAKSYASVAEAKLWGHNPIAMIAYVGDAENPADIYDYDSETDGDQRYTCLAIALQDVSGTKTWSSLGNNWCAEAAEDRCLTESNEVGTGTTMKTFYNGLSNTLKLTKDGLVHEHPAALAAVNYKNTVNPGTTFAPNSGWFLPSIGQWKLIVESVVSSDPYTAEAMNEVLESLGVVKVQTTYYWSSTEYNAARAWTISLINGSMGNTGGGKTDGRNVRAVLAF